MADQRPSRAFPAQFDSGCTGCGGEIEVGGMIRMHFGLAYHDDITCLPAIAAWGERRGGTYDAPEDPWV